MEKERIDVQRKELPAEWEGKLDERLRKIHSLDIAAAEYSRDGH